MQNFSDIQCDSNKVYKLEDVPNTHASDSQLQLPAFMTFSFHIMFESEGWIHYKIHSRYPMELLSIRTLSIVRILNN
jgi:hypothetical protein